VPALPALPAWRWGDFRWDDAISSKASSLVHLVEENFRAAEHIISTARAAALNGLQAAIPTPIPPQQPPLNPVAPSLAVALLKAGTLTQAVDPQTSRQVQGAVQGSRQPGCLSGASW